MKYKFLLITLLAAALSGSSLFAQFSLSLSSEQEYNSNPFRSALPESNFISAYDIALQYEFNDFGIMYDGTMFSFSNDPDRAFVNHMGGIWKNFESSAISLSAESRVNKPLYSYFDYYEISLNYENTFSFLDINTAVYPSVNYTSYKNISILDNIKSTLVLTFNKSFETGTTFIFGGAVNHKIYTQPSKTDVIQILNESNQLEDTIIESQNASYITQLTGFARIAQSITPTTGLAVQYTRKDILSGMASSVKALNVTYGDESEMFDDPVNYEGNSFLVELTQIFFEDLQLKLGYYNNKKIYPSQGVYNYNSDYFLDVTRNDTQNIFSVTMQKAFSVSDNLDISVGLKYYYINNSSNSYWFNYKANAFNAGISLLF